MGYEPARIAELKNDPNGFEPLLRPKGPTLQAVADGLR